MYCRTCDAVVFPPLFFRLLTRIESFVDGAGILRPLRLQTIAGDEYPVHGCWGTAPVAHPDFKRLAAEQHPDALGELHTWTVLLHTTDVATMTLDLAALGGMLVRGELDLDTPVLVVWADSADAVDTVQATEYQPTGGAADRQVVKHNVSEHSTGRQHTAAEDI